MSSPTALITAFFAEAYRVLKPGGFSSIWNCPLMTRLTPMMRSISTGIVFITTNRFIKTFGIKLSRACTGAGFTDADFFRPPCLDTYVSEAEFSQASIAEASFDEDTGRLSDTITWYAFGASKRPASP